MKTLTTTLSDKKSLDQKSSLEPLAQVELQCKRDVIYNKKNIHLLAIQILNTCHSNKIGKHLVSHSFKKYSLRLRNEF